ncbi:hypothetical protein THIOKS11570004 [Thiocapsa sp. KS1]|nr:hypothetical protein THIOKS11570004 [Thiocapsa sp. KS1]
MMTAQSGQTRLGRGGRGVCAEVLAGLSVVRRVAATAVVDRRRALALADDRPGAADVAAGSVGACVCAGSGVSSEGS